MIEAYPLTWVIGYERTPSYKRKRSPFKSTPGKAVDDLRIEVSRLTGYTSSGAGLIISTNIPVRKSDGAFYADEAARKIDEPGVAIYFKYKGNQVALCCDQYLTPMENIIALSKTINALRGIDRWGVSDFLNRTFTGFKELPEPPKENCWSVLGINPTGDLGAITLAFKEKAKRAHPDAGGTNEEFQRLQQAYLQAKTATQ